MLSFHLLLLQQQVIVYKKHLWLKITIFGTSRIHCIIQTAQCCAGQPIHQCFWHVAGKESGIKAISTGGALPNLCLMLMYPFLTQRKQYFDKSQAKHLKVCNIPAEGSQRTSEMLWDDLPCSLALVPSPPLTFLERPNERKRSACFQYSAYSKLVKASR